MTKRKHNIPPITDEEEARIQAQIASDPDAPEATDEQLAQATTFAEAFPELAASMKRGRGRPPVEVPLQQISIRLEPAVIEKFRATGPGWQRRVTAGSISFVRCSAPRI